MSTISREELRSIFVFALHVARVDNDFVTPEKNVLKRYMDLMHFSPEEKDQMAGMSQVLSERLDSLASDEAKKLLVKTLCAVAYSDGQMREEEINFINRVNNQLGNVVELGNWDDWGGYEGEVMEILQMVG